MTRPVLVINPSPDVYGADLQMVQSVIGLIELGRPVVVALPADGPLVARLQGVGAKVVFLRYPVLRKGQASLAGVCVLLGSAFASLPRCTRLIRQLKPAAVLVNTVTLPWWLLAARLAQTPVVAHLHEAENSGSRVVRAALIAPLRLAHGVVVISQAARQSMVDVQPSLAGRTTLIYNGVPGPAEPAAAVGPRSGPTRVAVVGRLSPRKAPDVALEAVAGLRRAGHDVRLEVAGTAFNGYEWYEDQLRRRAAQPDLAGAVTFSGYTSPIWPVLARADIVLAPSGREPFGNAVVEAQLACRPVVAAAAAGHLETVVDGDSGLLVPPGDASATSAALLRLMEDPELRVRLTATARTEAIRRFSPERYAAEMAAVLTAVMR